MRYRDLPIQTQREFPNNARTQGFGWLVRAGYATRENQLLPLGEQAIARLKEASKQIPFFFQIGLPFRDNADETFFETPTGAQEIVYCPNESCIYPVTRRELAVFQKTPFSQEESLPAEKVLTPECPTIEALANFLNLPKEKTAKALMFTRAADGRFVFVVVRGDMTLSEAKLRQVVGEVRLATPEEVAKSGAAAGYASPIGLTDALIVVDDLIPQSPNLVAGANEAGYHLLHTNCGRDYTPEIVADLVLADAGAACPQCGNPLSLQRAEILAARSEFHFEEILLALAETHHDDKGLTLPAPAMPFQVYLMQVPGKELDTRAKAEEIYAALQNAGITVLFDDRDERAGVKFNDADLIGCPVRITVGERGLKEGKVEVKPRLAPQTELIAIDEIVAKITGLLRRPTASSQ
ncbi:MAG: proline--tRNA ligase [Chloroflexota bacterium]